MEEKNTIRKKKDDMDSGCTGLLLESFFKGIQSSFDGALNRVHQAGHAFTQKLARRVFLFLFAFLGLIFLLVGLAQLLSTAYRFPGVGETLMGAFILLISLVLYVFNRDDRSSRY